MTAVDEEHLHQLATRQLAAIPTTQHVQLLDGLNMASNKMRSHFTPLAAKNSYMAYSKRARHHVRASLETFRHSLLTFEHLS